jgi:hypothetical protein
MKTNEKNILDYFEEAVKHPDNLRENIENTNLSDRARLLAFLQTRDSKLYKKVKEVMYEQ